MERWGTFLESMVIVKGEKKKRVIKALAGICTFFCFFLEIEYGRYR